MRSPARSLLFTGNLKKMSSNYKASFSIASVRSKGYGYNEKRSEFVKWQYRTRFATYEEAEKEARFLEENYQICDGNEIVYDSFVDGKCGGIDPATYGGQG